MGLVNVILLVVCSGLCFILGRRFPSRAAVEAAAVVKSSEPYIPPDSGSEPEYVAEEFLGHRPSWTFDSLYRDDPVIEGTVVSDTVTVMPPPPPPPLAEVPADDDDEEKATNFFASLNSDQCAACNSGDGNCTCTDLCISKNCKGWATDATQTGYHFSEEAVQTDRMCAQMDRETEDFLLRMREQTARYISDQRLNLARTEYYEAVSGADEASTDTMRAIDA